MALTIETNVDTQTVCLNETVEAATALPTAGEMIMMGFGIGMAVTGGRVLVQAGIKKWSKKDPEAPVDLGNGVTMERKAWNTKVAKEEKARVAAEKKAEKAEGKKNGKEDPKKEDPPK